MSIKVTIAMRKIFTSPFVQLELKITTKVFGIRRSRILIKVCAFLPHLNFRIELTNLGKQCNALNLGQGFPDYHLPELLRKSLLEVAFSEDHSLHQYARSYVRQLKNLFNVKNNF